MYTKFDFGKELAERVDSECDITQLSYWAHEKYMDEANKLDEETERAMMIIIAMDEGEEFVLTKEELLELAYDLQKEI